MYNGNLTYLNFESKLLSNNPMGNAARRTIAALLPENWNESSKYPTVWMLGGYLDNALTLVSDPGPLGKGLPQRMLEWQRMGKMPVSIVLFPDLSSKLGGTQFINSIANGPFMDVLLEEMLPFVEKHFSCVSEPRGRVLAGHSSGGYGSLVLPMLRPGVFGAAIVSAADSAFENSLAGSFANASITLRSSGGPAAFWKALKEKNYPEKLSRAEFDTVMTLAMASCFSPFEEPEELDNALNSPHFSKLPFSLETLELIPEVWSLWKAWDPVEMVKTKGTELQKLLHLHLDVGDADECSAQFGHRRISKLLSMQNVTHLNTEFSGTHSGCSHRWGERFKLLPSEFFQAAERP